MRHRRNGSRHIRISCRAYRPRTTHACCELTTTVLVAEVREPPHVTQTNDLASHRQHKLHFATPLSSVFHFLLFYFFRSCDGPIGLSFLSHSSCHGSVGQRKKRAWELLQDTLVGRGGRGPVTTTGVFLVSPWGSLILCKMASLASARGIFPKLCLWDRKSVLKGQRKGHWSGEMGPPAPPLHWTHPQIHPTTGPSPLPHPSQITSLSIPPFAPPHPD